MSPKSSPTLNEVLKYNLNTIPVPCKLEVLGSVRKDPVEVSNCASHIWPPSRNKASCITAALGSFHWQVLLTTFAIPLPRQHSRVSKAKATIAISLTQMKMRVALEFQLAEEPGTGVLRLAVMQSQRKTV